jgi:hypothetical protein
MLNAPYYNPGNLRPSFDNNHKEMLFKGQLPTNVTCRYRLFINIQYGYRGLMRQLQIDFMRDYNQLYKLIPLWAPNSDNNPVKVYIDNVCAWSGFTYYKILHDDSVDLIKLACAISRQENGLEAILEDVVAGYHLL